MPIFLDQEQVRQIKELRKVGAVDDPLLEFRPYKLQEEQKPKGVIRKTLDYLARGNYAVANLANSLFVEKEGLGEAFSDAWKGLKGEKPMFFSDVLENMGIRNKYVKAIVGFALDYYLDPMTYITFGVGKGLKLGLTTLNKSGKALLNETLKKQLPKYIKKFLAKGYTKEVAEELGRQAIEEAVLRRALKNPQKYIAQPALRIFGRKVPILSNVTTPVLKKIGEGKAVLMRTKPMRWIGEAFIGPDFIAKYAKDLTPLQKNLIVLYRDHYLRRRVLGNALAREFFEEWVKKVPNVADREAILNAIEKRTISKLPKKLQPFAKELKEWANKNITAPEMKAGVLRKFRGQKFEYVMHYPLEKLKGRKRSTIIMGVSRDGRIRHFETLEDLKKMGYTPIEDAAVAYSLRYAYSQNLLAFDDYVQKMLDTVGKRVDKKVFDQMVKGVKLPEGYALFMPRNVVRFYPLYFSKKPIETQKLIKKAVEVLDELENIRDFSQGEVLKMIHSTSLGKALKITDELPAYLLPKEIAETLNRASPYLVKEVSEARDFVRKVTGVWKTSVTSWFPAFHARNATSNAWLCYLAGMGPQDVIRFRDAFRLQKYGFLKRLGKDPEDFVIKLGKKEFKASELYRLARQTDVLSGWYMAELAETYEKALLRRTGKIGTRLTRGAREIGIEKFRAIGSAVENNARLALFFHRLAKGDDIHQAARHVKKFLFDYRDLTQFEKEVMRDIIPFYCVPDSSEILTRDGWKTYYTLKKGDIVLTYNVKTGTAEWQPVLDKKIFYHDQELFALGGKRGEILFTDGHRWVVREQKTRVRGKIYGGKEKIVRGYELNTNHNIVMVPERVEFPRKSLLTPEEAELLGWLITDGYWRFKGNYCEAVIYQYPNKFLDIVKRVAGGKPRKPHPDTGVVCVPVRKDRLKNLIPILKTRDFASVPPKLSRDALEKFYNAMYLADGTVIKRRGKGDSDFFAATKKEVLDAFVIAAFLLGKRTREGKRGTYVSSRKTMKVAGALHRGHYKGFVWCPKTPNGTWVMRQNGVVTITGNTWLRKNIPLELEQLVRQPGKYAAIKKAQHAIESLSPPPDERYLPDWMAERELFIRLPLEKDGNPIYINPDLAFQDLAYLNLKDPDTIRAWFATLHPAIKIPFETMANYNLFRGRNIVDPDLPEEITFREALKEELLDNFRAWTTARRIARPDVNAVAKLLDVALGLKAYPYDEIRSRYWYFQRKKREQNALKNYYLRKARERMKKKGIAPLPGEGD